MLFYFSEYGLTFVGKTNNVKTAVTAMIIAATNNAWRDPEVKAWLDWLIISCDSCGEGTLCATI